MDGTQFGYCRCGCGQKTRIINGVPRLLIKHHQPKGSRSPGWKGGKVKNNHGYVKVSSNGHPRSDESGYVLEHILIAEKALGRFLVEPERVHHVNLIKSENTNSNLVVCPNDSYHRLLHIRTKALSECGHSSWRKCCHCKEYADPKTMQAVDKNQFSHKACIQKYQSEYRKHHTEKASVYRKNYYRNNKEKWAVYNQH